MKTKQNQLKNYVQLGILFFGISLFLLNCERQEHHETTNLHDFSIKGYQVDKKDIPNIMGFINNDKARTSFSCGSIDDSVIYAAIDSLDIHTYTFPFYIEETPEDTFYNFVVKTSEETDYQPFVFKYIASNGFQVGIDDFDTFEGTLEIYHYDTFCGDGNTAGRTDEDDPCPTNTVGLHSGSGSNSEPGNGNYGSENNQPSGEDYYNNSGSGGNTSGTGGYTPCFVSITWSCEAGGTGPHGPATCNGGNGAGSTPTVSVYCPPSYTRTNDPCEQQADFSGATAVVNTRITSIIKERLTMTSERNAWLSNPENNADIVDIFQFLAENPNSEEAENFAEEAIDALNENEDYESFEEYFNTEQPPSCESFNFVETAPFWQESAVKNIQFHVYILDGNGVKYAYSQLYSQPILFGMPSNLSSGGSITSGLAAEISADVLNITIKETVQNFRGVFISSTEVDLFFRDKLAENYETYIPGGRVQFNSMSTLTPTEYKTNLLDTGNCN